MPERTVNETKRGRHSQEEGNAIGLTEAFMPIDDDFDDSSRSWLDDDADRDSDDFARGNLTAFDEEFDEEDYYDDDDDDDEPVKLGRHARHAASAPVLSVMGQDEPDLIDEDVASSEQPEGRASRKSRRKRKDGEIPAYMRKSRRTRNILLVAIALLVVLGIAGGVVMFQFIEAAQTAAQEQAAQSAPSTSTLQNEASDDATTVTAKKVSAPNLVGLLGLSSDAALAQLGEGAQLASSVKLNAAGDRLAEGETLAFTEHTVSLTSETSDSRMGYPSVYLTCDASDKVVRAGFSTTTTLLGFGSQSFEDVITNGRIVEITLEEAGASVEQGSVALPADKAEYTTYADDGTTPTMEYRSFSGESQVDDSTVHWSAVLSYDYTMFNVTCNLSDTVRVIYVYVE